MRFLYPQGYKAGLLTPGHYQNLTQCESLDGELLAQVSQSDRCQN